jgi:hypothetical protein
MTCPAFSDLCTLAATDLRYWEQTMSGMAFIPQSDIHSHQAFYTVKQFWASSGSKCSIGSWLVICVGKTLKLGKVLEILQYCQHQH